MAVYAVITAKGPRWNESVGIRDQHAFAEHAAFMDDMVDCGVICFGGPIDSDDPDDIALLAVQADTADDVRRSFAGDPWIIKHVFVLKSIRAWTIWLDGTR
jgi:uncharacterized protein YciI